MYSQCDGFSTRSHPWCSRGGEEGDDDEYERCQECYRAHTSLDFKERRTREAESEFREAEEQLQSLQSHLRRLEEQLRSNQAKEPSLTQAKQSMDQEWLPQKEECHAAFQDFEGKEQHFIPECARGRYDESCEKSCLESQRAGRGGCGVVEGNEHGTAHVRGGIKVPCAPPQPSWILGSPKYANPESAEEQCQRILQVQQPQFAQSIVKAGWLEKQGSMYRWSRHFAVFESSDAVRSAALRLFKDDPSTDDKVATSAQAIFLWDAKNVEAKDGKAYRFKNGVKCFKLHHFYTTYPFCIKEAADPSAEQAEWMNLISSSMNFSDWK